MLIQFPILIGLYTVLRSPLSYMLSKSWVTIANIANKMLVDLKLDKALDIQVITDGTLSSIKTVNQLEIMNILNNSPDKLAMVSEYISKSELINLNFLGLNLGITPSINPSLLFGAETMGTYLPLLILPIIAVALTIYSTILTKRKTDQNKPKVVDPKKKNQSAAMNNMMLYMLPLMTLYFAFILPASMALYWIITYSFQIGQQMLINKMQDKDKDDEKTKGKVEVIENKKGDKK
jgi:YidC/Oxa1 family membrane protein insertase